MPAFGALQPVADDAAYGRRCPKADAHAEAWASPTVSAIIREKYSSKTSTIHER
jgi:hypothetical protein